MTIRIFSMFYALLFAGSVAAQAFPTKPVTILVPYAAGGPTDILVRTLGERVSARTGQPVLVNQKTGANQRIATEYLLHQPADGYTTEVVLLPHATNPVLFKTMRYDTAKEFIGLIHLVNVPVILIVRADSPIKNLADFVAFAKTKPGEATFGSPAMASSSHLTMEMVAMLAGVSFTHIPYKGDVPALIELMGGRIVATVTALPGAIGHVRSGRLRGIGISSPQRIAVLPEVPTFAEQGNPDAVNGTWMGLIVRSGTPKDIVAKLNAEFNAALALPEVKEKLNDLGMTIVGGSSEQFTAFIRSESERWSKVIKARGIKVDE